MISKYKFLQYFSALQNFVKNMGVPPDRVLLLICTDTQHSGNVVQLTLVIFVRNPFNYWLKLTQNITKHGQPQDCTNNLSKRKAVLKYFELENSVKNTLLVFTSLSYLSTFITLLLLTIYIHM